MDSKKDGKVRWFSGGPHRADYEYSLETENELLALLVGQFLIKTGQDFSVLFRGSHTWLFRFDAESVENIEKLAASLCD